MARGSKRYIFVIMVAMTGLVALWIMSELGRLTQLKQTHGDELQRAFDPSAGRAPLLHPRGTIHLSGPVPRIHVGGLVARPQTLTSAWFIRVAEDIPVPTALAGDGEAKMVRWRGVTLQRIEELARPLADAAWLCAQDAAGRLHYVETKVAREADGYVVTHADGDDGYDLPSLIVVDNDKVTWRADRVTTLRFVTRPAGQEVVEGATSTVP